jgi:hypothetical protein
MKKAFAIACAVCMAIVILAGASFAAGNSPMVDISISTAVTGDSPAGNALIADTGNSPAGTDSSLAVIGSESSAELLPVDVAYHTDSLEIRKIYELSPDVDPGRLPRNSFEYGGYSYDCADILREVVIGDETKAVTVTETAESKKNDMDTVLGLLPQNKEYVDEDGFAGILLLNTATIKSEISGYGSASKSYTVSRSYPNLSNADTQHIPKTINDSGKTLQLQGIEWRTDKTYNVDDYEIGNRYTATAKYSGTKKSRYVKGYNITADYSGEAMRKGVTVIRYTVIFLGTEIPAPVTTAEPVTSAPEPTTAPAISALTTTEPDQTEPMASEPEQTEPITAEHEQATSLVTDPESTQSSSGMNWLPILISALALLGCGVCVYFTIKNRKESPHYEKVPDYNYTDTFADNTGGNTGTGNGDI